MKLGFGMKRILKFFATLGDALGLVILLGGLMIATNNARAPRSAQVSRRKAVAHSSSRSINARRAAA